MFVAVNAFIEDLDEPKNGERTVGLSPIMKKFRGGPKNSFLSHNPKPKVAFAKL